jgi:hypothetical protein
MKVTVYAAYRCECQFAMHTMDKPYLHLMHCGNPDCKHYGEIFEIPSVDVVHGKAYPPAGRK